MTKRDEIIQHLENRITSEYNKHKSIEWQKITAHKIYSQITRILDSYNDFLLKNGYTDTDIISEEPTALDQFLILNKLNKKS